MNQWRLNNIVVDSKNIVEPRVWANRLISASTKYYRVVGGDELRRLGEFTDAEAIDGGDAELIARQRLEMVDRQLQTRPRLLVHRLPFTLIFTHHSTPLNLVPGHLGVTLVRRRLVRHRTAGTQHVADFQRRRGTGNSCNRKQCDNDCLR